MAELHELDPATLRSCAQQMDDTVETIMSTRRLTAESSAVAGFAGGMAARYRQTAIEVEQARAKLAGTRAAERAMRAPTMELHPVAPPSRLVERFQAAGYGDIRIVPRSTVTGRRIPPRALCVEPGCRCDGWEH